MSVPHFVQSQIVYLGSLRCSARHDPSGVDLTTAAPVDNGGDGSSFSPTDLVGVALGSCLLTTMALVGQRNGVDVAGSSIKVTKEMASTPFRRIGRLRCDLAVPDNLSDEQIDRLRRAAEMCPVHKSLHPDVLIDITVERRAASPVEEIS